MGDDSSRAASVNICLDFRTVQPHFPGVGRYTANLARALIPVLTEAERLVLLSRGALPPDIIQPDGSRTQVVEASLSPFSLRQQWALPRVLRAVGADLYHSPFYLMPFRPGVPAVVTIYDLIPLRYPSDFTPVQ